MRYVDKRLIELGLEPPRVRKERERRQRAERIKEERKVRHQAWAAPGPVPAKLKNPPATPSRYARPFAGKTRLLQSRNGARGFKASLQVPPPQATPYIQTPIKTTPCVYCGYPALTKDHVVCMAFIGKQGRRKHTQADYGLVVPACRDCNTYLGSKLIPTVVDRAYHLYCNAKVRQRYSCERLEHLQKIAASG